MWDKAEPEHKHLGRHLNTEGRAHQTLGSEKLGINEKESGLSFTFLAVFLSLLKMGRKCW